MNVAEWLRRQAEARGKAPAVFHGREQMADYAGWHEQAGALAAWLAARGVQPGDRVGLFMGNQPAYLTAFFGVWYAGAVVVPVNAKLHGKEAAWIFANAEAGWVFADAEHGQALKEAGVSAVVIDVGGDDWTEAMETAPVTAPTTRAPGDLAWLFFTSGTTGQPKGVMITHRMLTNMTLSYMASVDAVTPDHTTLYAAPLSHGAGLYALPHLLAGARHVCPRSGGFEPEEIFDLAAQFGNLHLFAAPTMVKRMTQVAKAMGVAGAGLRKVIYGGGPMYVADIIDAVEVFGPVFAQIYGQGEAPMAITSLTADEVADRSHPEWRARLGSVGRAQAGAEVIVADADGREVARGTAGEIMARGDLVMSGYWRNPEGTAKTFSGDWLRTGDVGIMDAAGYLTLQDRSKDVIISGGTNIYPREVEECLLTHAAVAEVSVVGRPNAEWGEDVVAFVVCAPGETLDKAALEAHCLAHIARFKRPKAYFEVPDLPKNNYGKVLKTDLRRKLEEMER